MTSKEYLLNYKKATARVAVLQAEIEQLRAEAESITINLDGMPRSSKSNDRVARLAVQLADYETRLTTEMSELWKQRMKIVEQLGRLKDPKHQQVLYLRYIGGKRWEEIAVEMDYTYQWVAGTLHGRALEEFNEILEVLNHGRKQEI